MIRLPSLTPLPPLAIKLAVSHLAVVIAGILTGAFLPRANASHETLAVLTRRPLLAAVTLAFRYGEPEQARPLLQRAVAKEPKDPVAWGDAMTMHLHLAVLDGEQFPESGRSAHIAQASVACAEFGLPTCSHEELRDVARGILRDVH